MRYVLIPALFIIVMFLAFSIQNMNEAKEKPRNELLYFPSGKFIEQLSLEYRGIVADFLWLQTIQYYGAHMMTDREVVYLYRLFDVITKLNPQFMQCYVFGATLITYDQKNPELGMKLLDKGLINMPDAWQIPFIKGFLNYVYLRNYQSAYTWFKFAASKPDAPDHCMKFAASSISKKGDYITAMQLWSNIYSEADNKYNQERAVDNILNLISRELNAKHHSMNKSEFSGHLTRETGKYTFLPFAINISVQPDTVIVGIR